MLPANPWRLWFLPKRLHMVSRLRLGFRRPAKTLNPIHLIQLVELVCRRVVKRERQKKRLVITVLASPNPNPIQIEPDIFGAGPHRWGFFVSSGTHETIDDQHRTGIVRHDKCGRRTQVVLRRRGQFFQGPLAPVALRGLLRHHCGQMVLTIVRASEPVPPPEQDG